MENAIQVQSPKVVRSLPKSKPASKKTSTRRSSSNTPSVTLSYEQFQRLTVVAQVRRAFAPGARLAAFIGLILGGFVPVSVFGLVHFAIVVQPTVWQTLTQINAILVAGGLAYSVKTVFSWGKAAFGDTFKATGFVVLLEGILTFAQLPAGAPQIAFYIVHGLSIGALIILIFINAVASACTLQVRKDVKG